MFHFIRTVVVLSLLLVGCGLLDTPAPATLDPVEVRTVVWLASMIDMEGLRNGTPAPDGPPGPQPDSKKCDCPALCKADFAFPCDCADKKCGNPNCRNNPVNAKAEPPVEPPKPEPPKVEQPTADPGVFPVILPRVTAPSRMAVWTKECLPRDTLVVVVDDGCVPCKWLAGNVIAPLIATGWHVVHVSRSDNPELVKDLNVSAVPTTIGIRDGNEVGRLVGSVANQAGQLQPQATVDTIAGWFRDGQPVPTRRNINGTTFPLPPE